MEPEEEEVEEEEEAEEELDLSTQDRSDAPNFRQASVA
jgi:hypothetical protein